MSHELLFVVLVFAAYRVTRFVTVDTIVDVPRQWMLDRVPEKLGEGLTCPWCIGSWISFAVVAIAWLFVELPLPGAWFLAVAAGVGLVAKIGDE